MTQLPNYNVWIFRGDESTQEARDARLLLPDEWYVGHAQGGEIASGPHSSEAHALAHARLMTDTSGT